MPQMYLRSGENLRSLEIADLADIRTILVATDFSPPSTGALIYALGIAGRYQARVHVLHCFDLTPYMLTPDALQPAYEAVQRDMDRLRADLESKHLTNEVDCEVRVERGDPGDILRRIVRDLDPGVIVVGTHG